jgi:hypothetical protein
MFCWEKNVLVIQIFGISYILMIFVFNGETKIHLRWFLIPLCKQTFPINRYYKSFTIDVIRSIHRYLIMRWNFKYCISFFQKKANKCLLFLIDNNKTIQKNVCICKINNNNILFFRIFFVFAFTNRSKNNLLEWKKK